MLIDDISNIHIDLSFSQFDFELLGIFSVYYEDFFNVNVQLPWVTVSVETTATQPVCEICSIALVSNGDNHVRVGAIECIFTFRVKKAKKTVKSQLRKS